MKILLTSNCQIKNRKINLILPHRFLAVTKRYAKTNLVTADRVLGKYTQ